MLPEAEHRSTKYLGNGLGRDHGQVKQRLRPLRGCKRRACGDTLARGHGLIQNPRNGCSTLTAAVPRQLRLMAAWAQLAQAISRNGA